MTEVTAVTKYIAIPDLGVKAAVFTYTKAAAGDTLDTSTFSQGSTDYGFSSVLFAIATVAGAADPCTYSGAVITFTVGTGAGKCFVVGTK